MRIISYKVICLIMACVLICGFVGCKPGDTPAPTSEKPHPWSLEEEADERDTTIPEDDNPLFEDEPFPVDDGDDDRANSV